MSVPDRTEETEILLRRFEVLERLCQAPAQIRDLVEETDQSRRTINRAVTELESGNFLKRGQNGIEVTTAGQLARNRLEIFLSDLDDIIRAEEVLAQLPADTDIDPVIVAGGETFPDSEQASYRPIERMHKDLIDSDRYRALVPTLKDASHIPLLYEYVITRGNAAELVVSPEVYDILSEEFPRRMAAMAEVDNFSLFVGTVPRFDLRMFDRMETDDRWGSILHLVVLTESGGVHSSIVNDSPAALQWGETQFESYRNHATDRTATLLPGADQRRGSPVEDTAGELLPASLEREGFVALDVSYFAHDPVSDPATAWRTGLSLPEVHTGYAIERRRPVDTELSEGDSARTHREYTDDVGGGDLCAEIEHALTGGENCVVLGPPGSGKSTLCKQISSNWYADDRGLVLYRERTRNGVFKSVEDLVETATKAAGHTLIVVEDAPRRDASRVFRAIDELANYEDVSFLLDARDHEWRDWAVDPVDEEKFRLIYVPPVSKEDCKRLVDHFSRTAGRDVEVPAEHLWELVDDEVGGGTNEYAPNQMLRLAHRLATYADPLEDGPTALETAVASVYDAVEDDDITLSVAILANILNAAGRRVERGMLYAVADVDEFDVVDSAIKRLEGDVLFTGSDDGYRMVHEAWSTTFLSHLLDAREADASRLFGTAVSRFLSLADNPDRLEQIREYLGNSATLEVVAADPESWADETARGIYAMARERSYLAPLLGDGETERIELPKACSQATVEAVPQFLARAFIAGDYYDRAERSLERLPKDSTETDVERLLGLARVAHNRGELNEGVERCRECLALLEGEDQPVLQARARLRLGDLLGEQGDYDGAVAHYRDALEAFRDHDRQQWTAEALHKLGQVATYRGEYDQADEYFEQGIEIRHLIGDRHGEADSLEGLGKVAWFRGEYDQARRFYDRCLERCREIGDRSGEARSLNDLSSVAWARGDYEQAREYVQQSLEIREAIGDEAGQAQCFNNLGALATVQGSYDNAAEFYERSLKHYQETGNRKVEANCLNNLGEVAAKRGEYERARDSWEQSLKIKRDIEDRKGQAATLNNLGDLAFTQGAYDDARQYHQQSLEIRREIGDRKGEAQSHANLGSVDRRQGAYEAGQKQLQRSLELCDEIEDQEGRALCLVELGGIDRRLGKNDDAEHTLSEGLEQATDVGAVELQVRAHTELGALARIRGEHDRAQEHLEASLEHCSDSDLPREQGIAHLERVHLALADEDSEAAHKALREARESLADLGAAHEDARATQLAGVIAATNGSPNEGRKLIVDAIDAFEEFGAYEDAFETLDRLVELYSVEDDSNETRAYYDRARDLLEDAPSEVVERQQTWAERCQEQLDM